MKGKYNNHSVYAHNFSGFDGVFPLRILAELGLLRPIMKDGKMINIELRYNINKNKMGVLRFRDSLLMLPSNLRDLAGSFNVEEKSYFPYEFVNNPDVDLNYVGPIPTIDLWTDITPELFDSLEHSN